MFILFSTFLSIAILAGIYHLSTKRAQRHATKYQLLTLLRDTIDLLRRHRSTTHYSIQFKKNKQAEIEELNRSLKQTVNSLVESSRFENKPMYRILQINVGKMLDQWQETSVARNQMEHGKLIRHCLFLMNEITIAWLAEEQRDELHEEYHMSWQCIIDNLETLTQLRICIKDFDDQEENERIKNLASIMLRKLNQLAMIAPLSIASPAAVRSMQSLRDYAESNIDSLTEEQLYSITSDLSLTIFNSYDHLLSTIVESLYLPLPRLTLA